MALSKNMKIGLGVAAAGAALLWWKSSQKKVAAVAQAAPAPGVPTNAQIIANVAPGLIAAMQQAISPPVQSPSTTMNP